MMNPDAENKQIAIWIRLLVVATPLILVGLYWALEPKTQSPEEAAKMYEGLAENLEKIRERKAKRAEEKREMEKLRNQPLDDSLSNELEKSNRDAAAEAAKARADTERILRELRRNMPAEK